jgi:hypothetical protein
MLIASLQHSPSTGKMVRNETAQKKALKQRSKKSRSPFIFTPYEIGPETPASSNVAM